MTQAKSSDKIGFKPGSINTGGAIDENYFPNAAEDKNAALKEG